MPVFALHFVCIPQSPISPANTRQLTSGTPFPFSQAIFAQAARILGALHVDVEGSAIPAA